MHGDCHIHMILDGAYYRAAIDHQRERPDEALVRARLKDYQSAGVRFLRDGGDAWGVGLFAAKISPEYGVDYRTPAFPIHRNGRYGGFIGRGYDDLKGYAALVSEARRAGADFIKIMISGLMDFDRYGVLTSQALDAGEIRELIRIAHGEGFCVMAHANGAETVKAALEAGVDSVEHGAYLDAEAAWMLAESGAVWVPTLATIGDLIGDGRYPDEVLRPLLDRQMDSLRLCARLGGRIALGSDSGAYRVFHAQGVMDEYALLKKALGADADGILSAGEAVIRRRFRAGGVSIPAESAP